MALDAVAFGENDPGQRASHERGEVPVQEVVSTGGDGSETQGIETTRSGVYEILCADSRSDELLADDPDLREALETYLGQFGNIDAGSSWVLRKISRGVEGLVYAVDRVHDVRGRRTVSHLIVKVIDYGLGTGTGAAGDEGFAGREEAEQLAIMAGEGGSGIRSCLWPNKEISPTDRVPFARLLFEAQSVASRNRYQILQLIEGENGEEVFGELERLRDQHLLEGSEVIALRTLLTSHYLDAVGHLAREGAVCIDPKPGNCVVDVLHGGRVDGVDTGSLVVCGKQSIIGASPHFAAPELCHPSEKTPVYAFGNMLALCITDTTVNVGMFQRHLRVPFGEFRPHDVMTALQRIHEHFSDGTPPDDVGEYLRLRDRSIRGLSEGAGSLDVRYGTDVFSQLAALAVRMLSLREDERPSLAEAKVEVDALVERLRTVTGVHPAMDTRLSAAVLGHRREEKPDNILLRVMGSAHEILLLEDGSIRAETRGSGKGGTRTFSRAEVALLGPKNILTELGVHGRHAEHIGETLWQYQRIYRREDVQLFLTRAFPELLYAFDTSPDGSLVLLVERGLVLSVRKALKGGIVVRAMSREMTTKALEQQEERDWRIRQAAKEAGSDVVSISRGDPRAGSHVHVKLQGDKVVDQRTARTVIWARTEDTTHVRLFTTGGYALKQQLNVAREIGYCTQDMEPQPEYNVIPQEVGEYEKLDGPLTIRVRVRKADVWRVRQAIEIGYKKYKWSEAILIEEAEDASDEGMPVETESIVAVV